MATCRECIHNNVCETLALEYEISNETSRQVENRLARNCDDFINKSDYVKRERGEWISVNDRLPTEQDAIEGGFVLANTKDNVIIARWSDISKFKEFVTHWQPLPEPPKGE